MAGGGSDGTVLRQERLAYRRGDVARLDGLKVVLLKDAGRHAIDSIPCSTDSVSRLTLIVACIATTVTRFAPR